MTLSRKNSLIILLAILAFATFLRFWDFTKLPPGLYPDEAMNGNNALQAIHEGGILGHGKVFYPENNGREGLFINIQGFFLEAFLNVYPTPAPWMLHVPSAIVGILTVLGVYFLARELLGKERDGTALLATFFVAASFWHINFSRIGFRAVMAPLLLVWGIYLLMVALKKNRWLPTALAGLVYGLGMHTYIAYRITPLIIAFIFFLVGWSEGWRKAFRIFGIFTLFALIAAAPLLLYFVAHPADFLGRTSQLSVFASGAPLHDLGINIVKTIGMFFVAGDANWRQNIAGAPELYFPVAAAFALALVMGVRKMYFAAKEKLLPKDTFAYLVLFAWLLVVTAPVVISNEGIPHALRSILMIPAAYILAAMGAAAVYRWFGRNNAHPKILFSFSLLFILLVAGNAYSSYFIEWGENPNTPGAFAANYVEIGNILNALPKALPKYVIVEASGVDVHGLPMPTQTTMFITDTYRPEEQMEKNIHYIFPDHINQIPPNAAIFTIR